MREDSISIYNGRGVATDYTVKRSHIEAVVDARIAAQQRDKEPGRRYTGVECTMPCRFYPPEDPLREVVRELVKIQDALHCEDQRTPASQLYLTFRLGQALAKVRALLGDE